MPIVKGRKVSIVAPTQEQTTAGTYNLASSSVPDGNYAANSLSTDFTNPAGIRAGNVFRNEAVQNGYIAISKYDARDAEVELGLVQGQAAIKAYLRKTATVALYMEYSYSNGGTIGIGVESNLSDNTVGNIDYYWRLEGANEVLGINSDNNITLLFGAVGMDIYLKVNGVEKWREKHFEHTQTGKVAVRNPYNGYVAYVNGLIVRNFSRVFTYTNTDSFILDPRDLGMIDAHTTGSMSINNPYILTVADASKFPVGTLLIVETGGEATTGRGTEGVNGAYPFLAYENQTAMQADHSKGDKVFARDRETGLVWYYDVAQNQWLVNRLYTTVGSQTHEAGNFSGWYLNYAIPCYLRATVTARNGNQLTLSAPCKRNTTNANVHLDCTYIMASIGVRLSKSYDPPRTLSIPAGSFAFSEPLYIFSWANWTIKGAGKDVTTLFSPHGGRVIQFVIACPITICDLTLLGNAQDDHFGILQYPTNANSARLEPDHLGDSYFTFNGIAHMTYSGLHFTNLSDSSHVTRVKFVDMFAGCVAVGAAHDVVTDYCEAYFYYEHHAYISWEFVAGGLSDRAVFDNIYFYAIKRIGGFEAFNSPDVRISNITGVNTSFSSNSASGTIFRNIDLTIQADSLSTWCVPQNPLFNFNRNAYQGTSNGGLLENAVVRIEGYVDNYNNLTHGVGINADNADVTIKNYTYTAPAGVLGAFVDHGQAIGSDGLNTTVDNCTAINDVPGNFHGLYNCNIGVKYGVVKNSTVKYLAVTNNTDYSQNNTYQFLLVG